MRFLLNAPHTSPDGVYLETGRTVGDDWSKGDFPLWKNFVPSSAMTPLDNDAKDAWNKRAKQKGDSWGNELDALPIVPNIAQTTNVPQQPVVPAPGDQHYTQEELDKMSDDDLRALQDRIVNARTRNGMTLGTHGVTAPVGPQGDNPTAKELAERDTKAPTPPKPAGTVNPATKATDPALTKDASGAAKMGTIPTGDPTKKQA